MTPTVVLPVVIAGLYAAGVYLLLDRSLTRVLAACSAGAWRITGKQSKATLRMAASVTALIAFLLALTAVMNRVREQFPLPLATTSWIASIVAVTVASVARPSSSTKPASMPTLSHPRRIRSR